MGVSLLQPHHKPLDMLIWLTYIEQIALYCKPSSKREAKKSKINFISHLVGLTFFYYTSKPTFSKTIRNEKSCLVFLNLR